MIAPFTTLTPSQSPPAASLAHAPWKNNNREDPEAFADRLEASCSTAPILTYPSRDPTWVLGLCCAPRMFHLCLDPQKIRIVMCKLWPAHNDGELFLRHQLVKGLCFDPFRYDVSSYTTTYPGCSHDGSASHSCCMYLHRWGSWNFRALVAITCGALPRNSAWSFRHRSSPRPYSRARARLRSESRKKKKRNWDQMTMTRTHSNKVSTGCQPCPTDSNRECGPVHRAGGAINTC